MRIGRSTFGFGLGAHSPALPPPSALNRGLFVGGYSGGALANTDKYDFGTDVVTSGTNLAAASDAIGGTGNTVMAVFNGNGNTHKYVHATDTASITTTLSIGAGGGSASNGCGNETRGIFVRGAAPLATSKYFYADDTTENGTALPNGAGGAQAVGNSSIGIWAGGANYLLSSKYTYAGDTTAAATSLAVAHHNGYAAGTTAIGYILAGLSNSSPPETFTTATTKYTYAGDTISTGTSVNIRFAGGKAGCGNSTRGIFGGGIAEFSSYTKLKTTQKYTYSGDTVAAATDLGTARYDLGAASANPGGFS